MRHVLTGMLGLALCLGTIATINADDPDRRTANPLDAVAEFQKLDKNSDGKLSKEEFVAGRNSEQTEEQAAAEFVKADKDKDGMLTLEEYKAIAPKKPEKEPETRTPGVGAVSTAIDAAAEFRKLDKNSDGKVSKQEFVDGRNSEQTEEQAAAEFVKADKDKDGALTFEEYKAIAQKEPEKEPETL